MNTTTAAAQARVTIPTIRAWCRTGVIAAVKTAGRWVIDAASLARRITIGQMKKHPTTKPIIYSIETMTAIGGNRWTRGDKDRVYINNWEAFAGLEYTTYNSGNIASASWQGETVSNSQAYKLLGSISKVWYDQADGKIHGQFGGSESRVATREQVWNAVIAGIRTAIAAL